MNLKIRFKNKTFVATFVAAIVSFIYQILSLCGIAPQIGQEQVMTLINLVLTILAGLGILVDPTTSGVSDSARAMTYGKADYNEMSSMGAGSEEDTEVPEVDGDEGKESK